MKKELLIGALCAAMCASLAGCTLPGENADNPDDLTPDYSFEDASQAEKVVNYEWLLQPMFTFDNIISPDGSLFRADNIESNAYVDACIYAENGKYGFIDFKGNTLVFPDYEEYYIEENGMLVLARDTEYGREFCSLNSDMQRVDTTYFDELKDESDETVYYWSEAEQKRYRALEDGTCEPFEEDTTVVVRRADIEETGYGGYRPLNEDTSAYALAAASGLVCDFEYTDYYAPRHKDGGETAFALQKDGLWGYMDYVGNVLIDFVCSPVPSAYRAVSADTSEKEHPFLFSEGLVPVLINGSFGYYTIDGDIFAAVGDFQQARPVHNGRAWVCANGMWGVIKVGEVRERETSKPDLSSGDASSGDSWTGTTTTTKSTWKATTTEAPAKTTAKQQTEPAETTTTPQAAPATAEPEPAEPAEPVQPEPQPEPDPEPTPEPEPVVTDPPATEPEVPAVDPVPEGE